LEGYSFCNRSVYFHFVFNSISFIFFRNLITSNDDSSDEKKKSKHHSIVLPSINKSYFIKLQEITNRLSSIETCPTYSQPKSPIPLYFSPTILQDEQSENIRPLNQTQPSKDSSSNLMKPRVIIHRIDPNFLLDYFKKQENNPQ
jgi:hypothetical protein